MASSANQEANSNHNLSIQRQQQELVKLLTQHFHRQFYQLATSSNNNNNNNNNNQTTINGSGNIIQQTSILSASGVNHSQQQQQQSIQSSPAINTSTSFQQQQLQSDQQKNEQSRVQFQQTNGSLLSSSGFNLGNTMATAAAAVAANGDPQYQLQLHNHMLRSQPPSNNTGNSGNTNLTDTMPESLIDYTMRNSLNPYSMSDINLYNALGLTNNQLVLSLQQQQQSLLQASVLNSRLHDLRTDLLDDEHQSRVFRRNSNDTNTDFEEDNHISDGKGMLKFSINTILGRGCSPNQTAINPDQLESKSRKQLSPQQLTVPMVAALAEKSKQLNEQQLSTAIKREDDTDNLLDCDQSESGSDSSSIISSAAPLPHTSNPSFFNQSILPANHRSANPSNTSSTNQATSMMLNTNQQSAPASRSTTQARHYTIPYLTGSAAFPWTVATRGKPRRGMMRRAVFSDSQRVGLEKRFQLQKYISKPDRKKLAEKLGLRDSQVKIWFQNRRMKWRNSKERELLSAGGSREQTLPTRNNPNPDLSDVGETIKRITTTSSSNNNTLTGH